MVFRSRPWSGRRRSSPGRSPGAPAGGANALHAAEIALTDSKAAAVLGQRIDGLLAAPLIVEPGGDSAIDAAAADDLRAQLRAVDIDRVSRELLHAIWYGYALAECLWAIEGRRVRLVDIRSRDTRLIRWDPLTLEPLLVTRDSPAGVPLPPAKYILHRNPPRHGGQVHGLGAAHWCIWPVWLKRQTLRMWSTALEKFGSPMLIGHYRRGAPPEEVEALLATMAQAATASSMALPEGQDVQLLAAVKSGGSGGAGGGGGDFRAMIAALDRMIAEAVSYFTAGNRHRLEPTDALLCGSDPDARNAAETARIFQPKSARFQKTFGALQDTVAQ